jgi:hypothetical protein
MSSAPNAVSPQDTPSSSVPASMTPAEIDQNIQNDLEKIQRTRTRTIIKTLMFLWCWHRG